MADRYITFAQADRMRRQALELYDPSPSLSGFDWMRLPHGTGSIGEHYVDYYIVPDDDPRLQNQAPDPRAGARWSAP